MPSKNTNFFDIREYWLLTPDSQNEKLESIADVEFEAQKKQFNCLCKLENPELCWEEKHPNRERISQQCSCRCHNNYEPY